MLYGPLLADGGTGEIRRRPIGGEAMTTRPVELLPW